MFKLSFTQTLILSIFLSTTLAQLSILSPPDLQSWWKSQPDNKTALAAFGYVPWGRKIVGHLELANPIDACDYITQSDKEYAEHPIIVARRGTCKFAIKAHYAQLAGAKMLLIVDDHEEDVERINMVDKEGRGDSVRIPVGMISKDAGDYIIETLQQESTKISSISVVYDFNMNKTDHVNYNIWLSSSTGQSFKFVKEWKEYEKKLGAHATMQPHFVHFEFGEFNEDVSNCLCNGKYCAPDPDAERPNTGADVITEDLRQMCILKKYSQEKWLQYINSYDVFCLTSGDMGKCANFALMMAGIPLEDINACVDGSFDAPAKSDACSKNTLLDSEHRLMREDDVWSFPGATINGLLYRGSMTPAKGVFEAICESFSDMPPACRQALHMPAIYNVSSAPLIIGVVIFIVVFVLIVFCCYRRVLRKEMYNQIQKDVSVMVQQYAALQSSTTSRANYADEAL